MPIGSVDLAAECVAMTRTMKAGVGGMLFKSPVAWERVMNMLQGLEQAQGR